MQMTQHIIDISFEMLFYAYPTASLLCDSQGDILMANQAAQHLMQYKALELNNKNVLSFFPDLKFSDKSSTTSISALIPHGVTVAHSHPLYVHVECTAINDAASTYWLITLLSDRRRQAEHALQNILQAALPCSQDYQEQTKLASLTEREREVMSLAVAGYHNKEIARALGISHRTVEIHKSRIMHKTGASNLLELARMASASQVAASS